MKLEVHAVSFEAAIAAVSTPREATEFIEALLTPAEINLIGHRWTAFQMALSGATQREVRDTLGVSIATASRSARIAREYGPIISKIARRAQKRRKHP